jgi:hypothetical protein
LGIIFRRICSAKAMVGHAALLTQHNHPVLPGLLPYTKSLSGQAGATMWKRKCVFVLVV